MSIQAGNLRALEAVTHVRQFAAEMAEQLNLAASVEPPALNVFGGRTAAADEMFGHVQRADQHARMAQDEMYYALQYPKDLGISAHQSGMMNGAGTAVGKTGFAMMWLNTDARGKAAASRQAFGFAQSKIHEAQLGVVELRAAMDSVGSTLGEQPGLGAYSRSASPKLIDDVLSGSDAYVAKDKRNALLFAMAADPASFSLHPNMTKHLTRHPYRTEIMGAHKVDFIAGRDAVAVDASSAPAGELIAELKALLAKPYTQLSNDDSIRIATLLTTNKVRTSGLVNFDSLRNAADVAVFARQLDNPSIPGQLPPKLTDSNALEGLNALRRDFDVPAPGESFLRFEPKQRSRSSMNVAWY